MLKDTIVEEEEPETFERDKSERSTAVSQHEFKMIFMNSSFSLDQNVSNQTRIQAEESELPSVHLSARTVQTAKLTTSLRKALGSMKIHTWKTDYIKSVSSNVNIEACNNLYERVYASQVEWFQEFNGTGPVTNIKDPFMYNKLFARIRCSDEMNEILCLMSSCKSGIKHLQIAYIRASNKFDFLCLFLATWMDALAILAACGALARTLSICLDAMTGGLARILILGRNSSTNEPWPDVLGVAVVFLVTGMFMLGLENTKVFSFLMTLGMLGISGILTAMSSLRGKTDAWNKEYFLPNGFWSFLTASSLSTFSYPSEMPNFLDWKRLIGFILVLLVGISTALSAGCLSMIIRYKPDTEYVAVPLFQLLESNSLDKLIPAAACLLVLSCSGAFLELFPEMCNVIVRLATAEWKILARQISYESPESGSPMLAIFIAGSLCAMLAFACPLQNLTHILAASHFCAGLIRAFYLLYSPFRPKFIQQTNETSLSYSRLSTIPTNHTTTRRRSLWNFNKPIQSAMKKSKSKKKCNSEVEREWLLLGEPSSPRPTVSQIDAESSILSDGEPQVSDMEYIAKIENSDSDTSTDIDAIVDEYRQKVKVTTAGPMEKSLRVPSVISWRITILAIATIATSITISIAGIVLSIPAMYITGITGSVIISLMMSFLPKFAGTTTDIHPIVSTAALSLGAILLSACLSNSWPAIIFWILAGLILFARCDTWCCLCLERPTSHQIIPSVSGKTATIRIPRPPRGVIVPGRIPGHR